MDATRALLDSLMGQTRDASLDEAKKNKGKNFMQDNVCKYHLLGFCPQNELGNSKLTTKRNLGMCNKVHSDAMKTEFEAHAEKEKLMREYEKAFLPFLESQIREADAWVSRERANVQKVGGAGDKKTIDSMPESVKDQMALLTVDMNKMMAAAEELAEKGDIDGSKFKVVLAEEIKKKIEELKENHPSYTVTLKEEWVCDICGTRTEAITDTNEARFKAHFTGKVHLGYAKMRDWVKDLRDKQKAEDDKKDEKKADKGDRRRRRSRSKEDREKKRGGSREKEPEKKRGGSREKEGEERRRRRSRSREEKPKDRGGDRDRGDRDRGDRDRDRRRRDRSRSR